MKYKFTNHQLIKRKQKLILYLITDEMLVFKYGLYMPIKIIDKARGNYFRQ